MKILFVMDKYCEANSANGPAEWENNILGSLQSTGLASECLTFHFDEYFNRTGSDANDELLRLCRGYNISLMVLIIYREPGSHISVPNYNSLEIIRHQLNIPIVTFFGDIHQPFQQDLSIKLLHYINFNICTGSSEALKIEPKEKFYYYWVPKDARIFNNPRLNRDIDISYVGSPKPDRIDAINYLRAAGLSVYALGGERFDHVDVREYANILKRSKITLSFSRNSGLHVINARVFEATLCGAMLLEEDGDETPKMFTPFIDYVSYNSLEDLVTKVKYYLANEAERTKIAENGCSKSHVFYSAQLFWQSIIERIHLGNSSKGNHVINKDFFQQKVSSSQNSLTVVINNGLLINFIKIISPIYKFYKKIKTF